MKTFILKSEQGSSNCLTYLSNLPSTDKIMEVVIRPHKDKRNAEQNKLYWELLSQISEQGRVQGTRYSKQAWHTFFATDLMPFSNETAPFTGALVPKTTTKLSKAEFSEYIDKISAFAVTELGVKFNERAI